MKLQNFEIISSIELRSENGIWDLHNGGNFNGLELLPTENAAIMRWGTAYPWRAVENNFSGLELRFRDLEFLRVGPRDPNLPPSEDTCVSAIDRLDPNIDNEDSYLRGTRKFDFSDAFRWVFRFQSRRTIEIGCGTVELIPVA